MDIKEIRRKLSEKFNGYTLDMLVNYILEFEQCFGNMISLDELIQRVIRNLKGNFIIEDKIQSKMNIRRAKWKIWK